MATPDKEGPSFPVGVLAALALALAGLIVAHQDVTSSRPPRSGSSGNAPAGLQDIPGRLWQDPFEVIAKARQGTGPSLPSTSLGLFVQAGSAQAAWVAGSAGPSSTSPPGGRERLCDLARFVRPTSEAAHRRVDVIGVTMFGGTYPESAESRRRTRYAVVAGLIQEHYVPLAEEALGYISLPPGLTERYRQPDVPFEIFRRETGQGQAAGAAEAGPSLLVVLWLDEDLIPSAKPVERLSRYINQVRTTCVDEARVVALGGSAAADASPECSAPCLRDAEGSGPPRGLRGTNIIIGPSKSASLLAMSDEAAQAGEKSVDDLGMRFLALATISDVPALPSTVTRMLAEDRRLMRALVAELRRRHVPLNGSVRSPGGRIALISELDTAYGRDLPAAFEREVCAQLAGACPPSEDRPLIRRYGYLRGLDAFQSSPGAAKPHASEGKAADDDAPRRGPRRSEGDSQFDYVSRLADRIRDEALRDGQPITAIGLFGSDVYDKTVLLRALRQRFGRVVYFTTDLDARFLDPGEYEATRNLVVASGFGLELHPRWQSQVAPFRDSYQTATYYATRKAMAELKSRTAAPGRFKRHQRDDSPGVRLFEIGRGAAYDLSHGERHCPGDACVDVHPDIASIFPRVVGRTIAVWALIATSGALLLVLGSWRVRTTCLDVWRWLRDRTSRAWVAVGGIALVVICLGVALIAFVRLEGQHGEPMAFAAGISVWPSEILRMVVALLAVWCLVSIRRALEAMRHEFTALVGPLSTEPVSGHRGPALKDAVSWLRRNFEGSELLDGPPYDAMAIWNRFLYRSSFRSQACRVVTVSALFYLFGWLVIAALGRSSPPIRGISMWWIDQILLLAICVPLQILVIVGVSDTIRLVDKYAQLFSPTEPSRWPRDVLARLGRTMGMASDLPDTPGVEIRERALRSWLDMQVIAKWSDAASHLIYWPFGLLCLMLVARSPVFDDWETPYGLALVFGVSAFYAAGCAVALRRLAERARRNATDELTRLWIRARGQAALAPLAGQVELLLGEIKGLRKGAFAPLHEQPVVRAILLPFTSAGGLAVIQHFGWLGW